MRRHDIDFQILLEIGHMLPNIGKRRVSIQASAPGSPVNRTEHDVVRLFASGEEGALQFKPIDDQCFANQTEATCLVQKNEFRCADIFEVNAALVESRQPVHFHEWLPGQETASHPIDDIHDAVSIRPQYDLACPTFLGNVGEHGHLCRIPVLVIMRRELVVPFQRAGIGVQRDN